MNEYLLAIKDEDREEPPSCGSGGDENASREEALNKWTLAIDAACAPNNIWYPQDVSLLTEARGKQENMIYRMCKYYSLKLPRRYRRRARKDYLAFAKSRKHSQKQIRAAIKKQLSYVRRDIRYLEDYLSRNLMPDTRDILILVTVYKVYEQQEYMYQNRVHSVPERIVSLSQTWVRPQVRGKVKVLVEFGQNWK